MWKCRNYSLEMRELRRKRGNGVMEISKWCSEAGCLCRDLSLSCSEKGEIMSWNDVMVFWNGGNGVGK